MQVMALLTLIVLPVGAGGDGPQSKGGSASTAAPRAAQTVSSPPVDWRVRADELLNVPAGSVSLGKTAAGSLRHAATMPRRGKGFALLPHIPTRKTRYGTDELVGLLQRTAARVRSRFKYSVMRIGNIGYKHGGRIPWSISHRAGRDADIAFFTVNHRGRVARLTDFVAFDRNGKSQDGQHRFETRRNLEVVKALVTDDKVAVQWIFVSRHLRRKLLRLAKRKKLPAALITRLETVMKQPSDSAPHNDHFHVRIYCSTQDTLHGCRNRYPFHPWVTPATVAYTARLAELVALSGVPDASYRRRAIDKLHALNAQSAADTYIRALEDPDPKVFAAALSALKELMRDSRVVDLAGPLGRQTQPTRAAAIMALIARRGTPAAVRIATRILTAPAKALSSALDTTAERAATWLLALDVLGRLGRKEEAVALVSTLPSLDQGQLAVAAQAALERITNHTVVPRAKKAARRKSKSKSKSQSSSLVTSWRGFLRGHGDETWLQWLRLGFEARGYKFKTRMQSVHSIPVLIRAARHRDVAINTNAVRVLNQITGKHLNPNRRTRGWRAKYFKRFWRKNRRLLTRQ